MGRLRRSHRGEPRAIQGTDARGFLYLDSARTKEFLAGLERGTYDVEHEALNRESGQEVGGKIGVGVLGADVGVQAGRTTSSGHRVERDLAQTPESLFARLTATLRERNALRHVDSLDAATWANLEPGQFVEIVGSVSVGARHGLADAVVRAQALNRTFTDDAGGSLKEKALCGLIVRLYNLARVVPGVTVDPEVEAVVPESPDFRFNAKLDATAIRTELEELEESATLLGKVNRKRNREAELTLVGIYR